MTEVMMMVMRTIAPIVIARVVLLGMKEAWGCSSKEAASPWSNPAAPAMEIQIARRRTKTKTYLFQRDCFN
jgi:hypothetical protein